MRFRATSTFVSLAAGVLLQGVALAQPTTYSYTGTNYAVVASPASPTGTFTTSMRITGSFTTANPLPPNMPTTAIGPAGNGKAIAWSFSNGISTFTQANSAELYATSDYFTVATDSLGNISNYDIGLISPLPPHTVGTTMQFVWIAKGFAIQAVNNTPCSTVAAGVCTQIFPTGAGGSVNESTESGSFGQNFSIPVPALSGRALLVLAALMGMFGALALRRAP
jgi:hypothetical protein